MIIASYPSTPAIAPDAPTAGTIKSGRDIMSASQQKIVEFVIDEFAVALEILLFDIEVGGHPEKTFEFFDIHHMRCRLPLDRRTWRGHLIRM